jgi:hypothetical protein
MKSVVAVLAGTIVLAGCTTMSRDHWGSGYGSSSNGSDKPAITEYGPGTPQKPSGDKPRQLPETHKIPVTALPQGNVEAILKTLKGGNEDAESISIKNVAFIATFDRNGNISLVTTPDRGKNPLSQPKNITRESSGKFPIKTEAILGIKPFSIATYKGSHYIVLVPAHEENGVHVEPVIMRLGPNHPCDKDDPYPWHCPN